MKARLIKRINYKNYEIVFFVKKENINASFCIANEPEITRFIKRKVKRQTVKIDKIHFAAQAIKTFLDEEIFDLCYHENTNEWFTQMYGTLSDIKRFFDEESELFSIPSEWCIRNIKNDTPAPASVFLGAGV